MVIGHNADARDIVRDRQINSRLQLLHRQSWVEQRVVDHLGKVGVGVVWHFDFRVGKGVGEERRWFG